MRLLLIIFVFIFYINSFIKTHAISQSIKLSGVIYDQHPQYNQNFEPPSGNLVKGIVKTQLNPITKIPELNSYDENDKINKNGRILKPGLFRYFFSSNQNQSSAGYNIAIPFDLELIYNNSKGVFAYSSNSFFPINGKGFDLDKSKNRWGNNNYHFCLKFNLNFEYQGNEIFTFEGDDDFYVFINNRLVIDLGGLHGPLSNTIELKTLSLEKNKHYPIDIFFCERHTWGSNFKIETNIDISCSHYDYCGVCNGDGSTCCNPIVDCNDNNPCTLDSCPNANIINKFEGPIGPYCTHLNYDGLIQSEDICYLHQCNSSNGSYKTIPTTCIDKSNECLKFKKCAPHVGCEYQYKCNGICNIVGECNNGECVNKNSNDCVKELEIDGKIDLCYEYSCLNDWGCIKEEKCKQSTNPCEIITCNSTNGNCDIKNLEGNDCCKDKCVLNKCQYGECTKNGSCVTKPLPSIDDGNNCSIDFCDPKTGIITHSAIKCNGCMNCDIKTGGCVPNDSLCEDGNECSIDKCSDIGFCYHDDTNCIKRNISTIECLNHICKNVTQVDIYNQSLNIIESSNSSKNSLLIILNVVLIIINIL